MYSCPKSSCYSIAVIICGCVCPGFAMKSDSESDLDVPNTPPEIRNKAEQAYVNLLPEK